MYSKDIGGYSQKLKMSVVYVLGPPMMYTELFVFFFFFSKEIEYKNIKILVVKIVLFKVYALRD